MNKDFWLGLLTGIVIALILSMGIFYYYVVAEIQAVKQQTKDNIEVIKGFWKDEFKEDYQKATDLLQSQKDRLLDKLKEKLTTEEDTSSTSE